MRKKKEYKKPPARVPLYKTKIKIIGVGGGGGSIVSEIASKVKRANFVVVNTDERALKEVPRKIKRLQIGQKITGGLGTGMDPGLGEQAAREGMEKIKEIIKGQDLCVLVSCLGGGVGSGASPVFGEISKELKNITLGIFTLPFEFEGKKKMEIAQASLEKLKPNLNACVILSNEKIFQISDKNTPLKQALSAMNKFLAESLEGLIEIIYSTGLINIGWADLKTTLKGRGKLTYLNIAQIKGTNQIEEMAKKVLSNPLCPYSPKGATEILFNIAGDLNLNMGQVGQIGKTISETINPQAGVVFGISQEKAKGIKITLLANGCKWGNWEKKKPAELLKVPQPETFQISAEEKSEAKIKEPSE